MGCMAWHCFQSNTLKQYVSSLLCQVASRRRRDFIRAAVAYCQAQPRGLQTHAHHQSYYDVRHGLFTVQRMLLRFLQQQWLLH